MNGISVGYKPGKGGATPQPAYQEKTISIVENGETSVVPDGGFDTLSKVNVSVNVPPVTADGWVPPSGWPDMQAIYDGILSQNPDYYASVYLMDDSESGISVLNPPAGMLYVTSDAPTVTNPATAPYSFTGAGDIDSGMGYKVRWAATLRPKATTDITAQQRCLLRDFSGNILGTGLLWIIGGDFNCILSSDILLGGTSLFNSNQTLVSFKLDIPLLSCGSPAFQYMPAIENIEFSKPPINPKIQIISHFAYNCPRLVWFKNGTYYKTIDTSAFSFCPKLKGFQIAEGTVIRESAFSNSGFDSPVTLTTTPGSAAFNVSYVPSLFFKRTGVTNLNASFTNMRGLRSIGCSDGFIPAISGGILNFSLGWFSRENLVAFGTALGDNTGNTLVTLSFGTANLAKLSDEDKAIFTNKNYGLA